MNSPKAHLRQVAAARRAALSETDRCSHSEVICEHVLARLGDLDCRGLLVYAAMRDEVDPGCVTTAALGLGIPVAYPLIDWSTRSLRPIHLTDPSLLRPGRFGVPEPPDGHRQPFDPTLIDVILAPGLAFDVHGCRLGYGAGMYDRLFDDLPDAALRWGLAFEAQVMDAVPAEAHDRRLDAVVTERRWIVTEARHG